MTDERKPLLWSDSRISDAFVILADSDGYVNADMIMYFIKGMRDSYELALAAAQARIVELELANERLIASADPEALTIVYGMGVSDERNRWRNKTKQEATDDAG